MRLSEELRKLPKQRDEIRVLGKQLLRSRPSQKAEVWKTKMNLGRLPVEFRERQKSLWHIEIPGFCFPIWRKGLPEEEGDGNLPT